MSLHTKHPSRTAVSHFGGRSYEEKLDLWCDIYLGGDNIEGRERYLPRHTLETDRQYRIRLERAAYRNYARPVVGVWNTHIWRTPPVRDPFPEPLKRFLDDVDRQGTPVNRFFSDLTRRALYQGVYFVLVDAPKGTPRNRAEADSKNLRPYFVPVSPNHLLDWAFVQEQDGRKVLDYVVIRETVEDRAGPFTGHTGFDQWRVFSRNAWEVWRLDAHGQPERVDQGENALGFVPIVPFYFEEIEPMIGKSLIADIASLCLRVFRKENEKDVSEFYTSIPFIFFRGFEQDELDSFALSSSNGVRSGNTDAAIEIIEARGTAIESMRRSIDEDHRAIQEIALRQVRPDSAQAESFKSRKLDKIQLDTQLALLAQDWAVAEARCWRIAAGMCGLDNPDIKITYNLEYDVEDIDAGVLQVFLHLLEGGHISRGTFLDRLKAWELLPADFETHRKDGPSRK